MTVRNNGRRRNKGRMLWSVVIGLFSLFMFYKSFADGFRFSPFSMALISGYISFAFFRRANEI